MDTPDAALRALEAQLDEERLCLREGRYDGLAAGLAQKAHLLRALSQQRLAAGPADLARVMAKSRRNDVLLAEAARGLSAAIRRISELRRVLAGADTYRADGSRDRTAPTAGRLHKRS